MRVGKESISLGKYKGVVDQKETNGWGCTLCLFEILNKLKQTDRIGRLFIE